jgi:hypothetical protein
MESVKTETFEDIDLFSPPIALPFKNLRAPNLIGNHLTVFRKNEDNDGIQGMEDKSVEVGRNSIANFTTIFSSFCW